MKKITYIFIFIMLGSTSMLSAQGDYNGTLNNGRSISATPASVQDTKSVKDQAVTNNTNVASDQDVPGAIARTQDYFYPEVLEGLRNELISNNNGSQDIEMEERLDDLAVKVYDLALFNEQLRLENQDIRESLELCCQKGDEAGGSFLVQNAPNPFNERTSIDYFISGSVNNAFVEIKTVEGQLVRTIPILDSGYGSIELRSEEMNTGYYVYALHNNSRIIDSKVLILTK